MNEKALRELLEAHSQTHLMRWWDELDAPAREELARRIGEIDWSETSLHAEDGARGEISPIAGLSIDEIEERKEEFYAVGRDAIRAGKAAAVLLAGIDIPPRGVRLLGLTVSSPVEESDERQGELF